MSIKIFPYMRGSKSARLLANTLGCRLLRRENSRYRQKEGDLIINWGASDCPFNGKGVANQPNAINPVSNKLKCFELMKEAEVNIPRFWTDPQNIPEDAFPIMCRTKLQAHSGEGIVVAENRNELVDAPLYTQYMKKKQEYRVHVLRKPGGATSIITSQRKAKRHDADVVDFKIRNLANGFVYVNEELGAGSLVAMEAKKALESTDLAFGAVDIIWNEYSNTAYVLEINTAPGLEERTAQAYAEAFKEIYKTL